MTNFALFAGGFLIGAASALLVIIVLALGYF